MTIAVGVLVPRHASLVIAADSQETYGDAKIVGDKITVLECGQDGNTGAIVFSGAGSAGYIDSVGQDALDTFLHKPALVDNQLKKAIEDTFMTFYARHVRPFGESWTKNDQLDVQALMGWQRNGKQAILSNHKTALREHHLFHAVGTGATLALALLRDLYRWNLTLDAAARLVAYVIHRAKNYDPYCGKQTEMVTLTKNHFSKVQQKVLDRWDQQFDELTALDAGLLRRSLGVEGYREGDATLPEGMKFDIDWHPCHFNEPFPFRPTPDELAIASQAAKRRPRRAPKAK